jgi:predicted DNA-binding transcriptional regulator AlpA
MGTRAQSSGLRKSASQIIKPLTAAPHVPHDVPRPLPLREVIARVGISRGQVYLLIGEQRFPRPLKVGRRSLWHSPKINDWIEDARVNSSRAPDDDASLIEVVAVGAGGDTQQMLV